MAKIDLAKQTDNYGKDLLDAFMSASSYAKLKEIADTAKYEYKEIDDISIKDSYKYLYGNKSLIIECKKLPIFRIAGSQGAFRIMTPTTGDYYYIDQEIIEEHLRTSELLGRLLNFKILRLKDHDGRKFNVLFEFRELNESIRERFRELAWLYLTIALNSDSFKLIARDCPLVSSVAEIIPVLPATKPWEKETIRNDMKELYEALDLGDGEPVYLSDGCWLTANGDIIER